MAWAMLFIAGLFEVGWAVGLKYTHGFTRLAPSVATIGAMVASMGLLGLSVRSLPIGTAYAVWTGIGTIGTVTFAIFFLGESASPLRVVCLSMIVMGIIGLKFLAH